MKVSPIFSKDLFSLLFSSLMILSLAGCAQDNNILDNGSSKLLGFSVTTHSWNSPNNLSLSKMASRATPISETTFDTSNSFNVIADVNNGSSWTNEIDNETVSYSDMNKIWETTTPHYWPGANSTVNFYAYYPTTISENITHTAGSAPVLTYTVPEDAADQIDILTSSNENVSGNSYSQLPVDFKHIFAAVTFTVGNSGMINGTITKISLSGIQHAGSYDFSNGWTLKPDATTYTKTVSAASTVGTEIVSDKDPFLVLPQTLSNASFTVTYSGGATLTKSLSGTWETGRIYNYNINSSFSATQDFDYTGNVQSYVVPFTGTYKLEVWGAQGGHDVGIGGFGGYSSGMASLKQNDMLYVVIGGEGLYSTSAGGGYNGGGNAGGIGHSGGGGGSTCITGNNRGVLSAFSSYRNEVYIVAGGGGGAGYAVQPNNGGYGGGDAGGSGYGCSGGSQTSGYTFGQGQNCAAASGGGGGGGGGWYGGYAATADGGGAGGSGYVGGVTNGQTIAGNSSMPAPSGGAETGHSGNGYARITFVSAN